MAEHETMREALGAAIDEFMVSNGGGFRLAFVYAVEVGDDEGHSMLYLGSPSDQPTYRSVGLTEYLRKWFDLESVEEIGAATCTSCGDDED